jgi:hypothetical protein
VATHRTPMPAEREAMEKGFNRQYHPCVTGIHVCSVDDDAGHEYGPHVTLLNVDLPLAIVEEAFEAAKALFGEEGSDADLSIDLMIDDDLCDNFFMWRQMLPRMEAYLRALAAQPQEEGGA